MDIVRAPIVDNRTKAVVERAWFGSSEDFPMQYGLWLTFRISDERTHTTAAITISLNQDWGTVEKIQVSGSMFLRIARLLYKTKSLSIERLAGRAALLEMYGGNCLRDFEILPERPTTP